MKGLSLYFSFDLLLPWSFGPGRGWGFNWFDLGPFAVWWTRPTPDQVVSENKWRDAVKKVTIDQWNDAVADIMKWYR